MPSKHQITHVLCTMYIIPMVLRVAHTRVVLEVAHTCVSVVFQMEERQRMQAAKKAEQEAYDKKLNAEIANYNPFGRGGAGAPMKDNTGNVIGQSLYHSSTSYLILNVRHVSVWRGSS